MNNAFSEYLSRIQGYGQQFGALVPNYGAYQEAPQWQADPRQSLLTDSYLGVPIDREGLQRWEGDPLGETPVPSLISNFVDRMSAQGSPLEEATRGRFRQEAEGLVGAERERQRMAGSQAAAYGLSPELFDQQQQYRRRGFLGDLSMAEAGAEADYNEALFNLEGNALSGITQAFENQRSLELQRFLASKARESARKGAKGNLFGDVVGLAGNIGTSLISPGGLFNNG